MEIHNIQSFSHYVAGARPAAEAILKGNDSFPDIRGAVRFYPADKGTLVVTEVMNLPTVDPKGTGILYGPFYAFHIHDGDACGAGTAADPFKESGMHYNPTGRPHPYHVGDMPPLLGSGGYAYMSFYTGRFTPAEVIGKTVIVHQHAEDFKTQPSGDAGEKLACGVIMAVPQ